jgi:HEAT repeat protein
VKATGVGESKVEPVVGEFPLSSKRCVAWMTLMVLLVAIWLPVSHLNAIELDSLLDNETGYAPHPEVIIFHPRLLPLWMQALGRPETDLQRQAAQAIVAAHRQGMNRLDEAVPQLIETLRSKDLHSVAAFDIARALIELDASQAAETLMDLAQRQDLAMSLLIEPALVKWDFLPMREVWISRLDEANVDRPLLLLAIESLGQVAESRAIDGLAQRALDQNGAKDLRTKSARAAGILQREGFEEDAATLLQPPSDSPLIDRIVAALLLRHHNGLAAEQLLLKLAVDPAGAVGAVALARFAELDPSLVEPINEEIASSRDANVRRLAAKLLVGQRTIEAVELLGLLLNDPIPDIRISVADSLVQLDEDDALRSAVREAATKMLMTDQPLGQEQSSMVLGAIDHEPVADRLVELLEAEQAPVGLAAAWALRELAVKETGDAMFEKVRRETDRTVVLDAELWKNWHNDPGPMVDFEDLIATYRQLDQLVQALGIIEYGDCENYLKKFFPTPPVRGLTDPPAVAATFVTSCRANAIWSLSRVAPAGSRQEVVALLLELIQKAPTTAVAEPSETRAAAALGLAHLEAREAIPILRNYRDENAAHNKVGATCGRVLHELAGDPLPELVPLTMNRLGWFLEPLP